MPGRKKALPGSFSGSNTPFLFGDSYQESASVVQMEVPEGPATVAFSNLTLLETW